VEGDEEKIMYTSYLDHQLEQIAKKKSEPEESKEGPTEEQKTDASAETSQTAAANTDATEEKKEEVADLNWKEMVHKTDRVGPSHGDTTNTSDEDINKLKEAHADNKLP
jgi:hypothetical protein